MNIVVENFHSENVANHALEKRTYMNSDRHMADPLLSVEGLTTEFKTIEGSLVAVNNVDLTIRSGEMVGLVGESGCGKSMTALSIMRLVPSPPGKITSGKVILKGTDLLQLSKREMRRVRGSQVAMIFQDPATFLNPIMRVGNQIAEAIRIHQDITGNTLRRKVIEALRRARIPDAPQVANYYPHQLSGGMRQRVMIAMAISSEPALLIADEPTTALDVTIQGQILELIANIAKELGTSLLLITHDLSLLATLCDRVYVMYAGQIVEEALIDEVFSSPAHPYTQGLIKSIPRVDHLASRFTTIPGDVPNLLDPPKGCRFHPRCPFVMDECREVLPPSFKLGDQHQTRCWLYKDEA